MTSQPSAAVPNKSFSCPDGSWTLDFSALQITAQQLKALGQLPQRHGLPAAIRRLFSGQVVNPSENRSALHALLRASGPQPGIDLSAVQRPDAAAEPDPCWHWRLAAGPLAGGRCAGRGRKRCSGALAVTPGRTAP